MPHCSGVTITRVSYYIANDIYKQILFDVMYGTKTCCGDVSAIRHAFTLQIEHNIVTIYVEV